MGGKGGTRHSEPEGAAARSSGGRARTAEAGRAGALSRHRGCPRAACGPRAPVCNGDLPPLRYGTAGPVPHRASGGGTTRGLEPAALPSAPRALLRPHRKLPLLRRRLAGLSAPRHSLVRAFARWFEVRRGCRAGIRCCLSSPSIRHPLIGPRIGSEYLNTAFVHLFFLFICCLNT